MNTVESTFTFTTVENVRYEPFLKVWVKFVEYVVVNDPVLKVRSENLTWFRFGDDKTDIAVRVVCTAVYRITEVIDMCLEIQFELQ